jgi:hypothetical protein
MACLVAGRKSVLRSDFALLVFGIAVVARARAF